MHRHQYTRIARSWAIFLVVVALASAAYAQTPAGLRGRIVDGAGSPVEGVQVFLGRTGEEIVSVLSDRDGRFLFEGIRPGGYTLLAIKDGYQAAFSRVNTVVQHSLDLTLNLLGETVDGTRDQEPRRTDAGWMLRLPRRDLLREVERDAVPVASRESEGAEELPAARTGARPVQGRPGFQAEIRQWYSMAWRGELADDTPDDGTVTQVALSGQRGDSLVWAVAGELQRSSLELEDNALSSHDASSQQLQFNVDLAPNPRNQVGISAYFDQSDLSYALADFGGAEGRDTQMWGYDAAWSTRLGAESDLDLQVGYGAARADGAGMNAGEDGGLGLSDQRWRARGAVTFTPAAGHRLQLGMRAHVFDFDSEDVRLTLGPQLAMDGLMGTGRQGWTVSLYGRDTFDVASRLALDVGFDYHHIGFEEVAFLLVPQAGVTYRPTPGQTVRALVTVNVRERLGGPEPEAETFEPRSRVGYLVSWERESARNLSLAVAAAIRPFTQEMAAAGPVFAPTRGGIVFASDGNASSRELSFRVEKRMRVVHSATGMRVGDMEGRLLSYVPGDIPSQSLGYNLARFVSTTVDTVIVPTGTNIGLTFHWVDNDNLRLGPDVAGPVTFQSLDMMVQQQLQMVPGRAQWKVLLAYREILNQAESVGESDELTRIGVADQLRRVSGGVSVSF